MKVIDLFNKIAKGEIPNGFKFKFRESQYHVKTDRFSTEIICCCGNNLEDEYIIYSHLNDEIEIIEGKAEDKHIEELLIEQDCPSSNYYIRNEFGTKCGLTKHSKMIAEKVNEIAREVNKLKKKENE